MVILEEIRYSYLNGKDITNSFYFKKIRDAIMEAGVDIVDFHYVINDGDEPDNLLDSIIELIGEHKQLILMGKTICEAFSGKKFAEVKDKIMQYDYLSVLFLESNVQIFKKNIDITNTVIKFVYNFKYDLKPQFELVTTIDRLEEIKDYFNNIISFDIETTGLDYFRTDEVITTISLQFQLGYSYIIPIEHKEFTWNENEFYDVITILKYIFNKNSTKVAHNIKFEMNWLRKYGIILKGRIVDTMIMSRLVEENERIGLKHLTCRYFPWLCGYEKTIDFKKSSLEDLAKYNGIDTDVTLRLYYIFENYLLSEGNSKLYVLLRNLKMPAVKVLHEIEYKGTYIDKKLLLTYLNDAERALDKKIKELLDFEEVKDYLDYKITKTINDTVKEYTVKLSKYEENVNELIDKYFMSKLDDSITIEVNSRYSLGWLDKIYQIETNPIKTSDIINFGSHIQVKEILYDWFKFELPLVDGKPTRTSNRDYIINIKHPFIIKLSAARTIKKMISTYYKGILERLDENNYLHSSFNVAGTITGRLSSSNPNLQNIPVRLGYDDEDALLVLKNIKKFFIFEDYFDYLYQADYSQAELRMIACVSNDENMINAYKNNIDLHSKTAAAILNITLEEFYKLEKSQQKKARTGAKGANFGWVYKASIDGYIVYLKTTYGIDINKEEAQIHKDAIFKTYPKIKQWHKHSEAFVEKYGYIEDIFGYRRRFYNMNSNITSLKNKDIRDLVNNPIQGSIGHFTLFVLTLLYHRLDDNRINIWNSVHDSILFKDIDTINNVKIIADTGENPPLYEYFNIKKNTLPVKFKLDFSIGNSWGELEEIGDSVTFINHLNN